MDWEAFWGRALVSSIFLALGAWIIPMLTIRILKRKNKGTLVRRLSYILEELSEYLLYSPFKTEEHRLFQTSIFTRKSDLKNHRFVGLVDFNAERKVDYLYIQQAVLHKLDGSKPEEQFELLSAERDKLEELRLKLEKIIEIHSDFVDSDIINEVGELCLEIRSFDIRFKMNNALDDLIASGESERIGVFGAAELSQILKRISGVFEMMIALKYFDIEIKKKR